MNGILTSRCCCEKSCCSVSGPSWANRYCFQMSGYEATYEWKECRSNYVDPTYGPRYCEPVPEQGADTDAECEQNSVVCHRKFRQTASAAGAVFRGIPRPDPNLCCNGCVTECPNGPVNDWGVPACWYWFDVNNPPSTTILVGVCDKPTWVPPDVTPTGCDTYYESPPCNCEIAENDRAVIKGVVQDLDLSGFCQVPAPAPDGLGTVCVPMDEVDQPYECRVVASMYCATPQVGVCGESSPICSSPHGPSLVRHYFRIIATGIPGGPESSDCPGPFDAPCAGPTSFLFEADLGPNVPPDQAVWTCIEAPVYCAASVCDEPNCGETYPDEPCGLRSCEDWQACYSNADNPECDPQDLNCRGCAGPSTLVLPTLTFLPYQNCVFP